MELPGQPACTACCTMAVLRSLWWQQVVLSLLHSRLTPEGVNHSLGFSKQCMRVTKQLQLRLHAQCAKHAVLISCVRLRGQCLSKKIVLEHGTKKPTPFPPTHPELCSICYTSTRAGIQCPSHSHGPSRFAHSWLSLEHRLLDLVPAHQVLDSSPLLHGLQQVVSL